MRIPKPRRRWVVLAAVALLVFASIRFLDRPTPIDFYRIVDPQTLGIDTTTGPGTWTRVTSVAETDSSVTVVVSAIRIQLGPAEDTLGFVELTVKLSSPIAGRTVVDGSNGQPVSPARGPWPPQLGP